MTASRRRTPPGGELREELGIEATDWAELGTVDLDTSNVRCKVTLYVATGLTHTGTEHEATEDIETLQLPLDEAVRMVMANEITHAASCVLILRAGWGRGASSEANR